MTGTEPGNQMADSFLPDWLKVIPAGQHRLALKEWQGSI
jgi:hypothetical protein